MIFYQLCESENLFAFLNRFYEPLDNHIREANFIIMLKDHIYSSFVGMDLGLAKRGLWIRSGELFPPNAKFFLICVLPLSYITVS